MEEQITITKANLRAMILRWTEASRSCKTASHAETDAQPIDVVVDVSTNYAWEDLKELVQS